MTEIDLQIAIKDILEREIIPNISFFEKAFVSPREIIKFVVTIEKVIPSISSAPPYNAL